MVLSLTPDQKHVLQSIIDWWRAGDSQFITFGGYAGTGKTTLLGILRKLLYREDPKLKVAFCAYTGKASRVLESKLIEQKSFSRKDKVSTIHGLIYEMIHNEQGQVLGWKLKPKIDVDLIIVDEASMVSEKIWYDMLGYDVPIIAVGDHGQLPPIEGDFNLMEDPQLRLEKIHRQAAASPIIQLSIRAREDGVIPVGVFGDGVVKYDRADTDIGNIIQDLVERWDEETMFLVGMNWMRKKLNQQVRQIKMGGYEISSDPKIGDRVICLRNNWEHGIYNGMLGNIKSLSDDLDDAGNHHWYLVDIAMDDGTGFSGRISKHQFDHETTKRDYEGVLHKDVGELFDFGYALTVHKAQGSQARKVVVFEGRNKHMTDEDWRRWLYTAVTRAEEELVIIGD